MALDQNTQTALAQEVRRQQAALRVESIKGQMTALGNAAQVIGSLSQDAGRQYVSAHQELAALQIGAGPGLTSEFGQYSTIDQLLRAERFAGKAASIDAIKANPQISEADAEAAWTTAALAETGRPALVVPVASYSVLYRANLLAAGLIPVATYEAQRAWIVATDKDAILGI